MTYLFRIIPSFWFQISEQYGHFSSHSCWQNRAKSLGIRVLNSWHLICCRYRKIASDNCENPDKVPEKYQLVSTPCPVTKPAGLHIHYGSRLAVATGTSVQFSFSQEQVGWLRNILEKNIMPVDALAPCIAQSSTPWYWWCKLTLFVLRHEFSRTSYFFEQFSS